jgi:hypothetical protein
VGGQSPSYTGTIVADRMALCVGHPTQTLALCRLHQSSCAENLCIKCTVSLLRFLVGASSRVLHLAVSKLTFPSLDPYLSFCLIVSFISTYLLTLFHSVFQAFFPSSNLSGSCIFPYISLCMPVYLFIFSLSLHLSACLVPHYFPCKVFTEGYQ